MENGSLLRLRIPNCGYCKRLAKDLQKVDNLTVYVFLYPILSEDSLKNQNKFGVQVIALKPGMTGC